MLVLIVLFSVVALMTGCTFPTDGKVTGGGWFMACVEDEQTKCTFGFNAQGDGNLCEGMEFKGQFQFNDHAGTKIHAKVMRLYEYLLADYRYKFVGETKGGEEVVVTVEDLGQPGMDPGDGIRVEYEGDTWEGYLGGGNIQIH